MTLSKFLKPWEDELREGVDVIQLGLAAQMWMDELGIHNWTEFYDSPMEPLVINFLEIDKQIVEEYPDDYNGNATATHGHTRA